MPSIGHCECPLSLNQPDWSGLQERTTLDLSYSPTCWCLFSRRLQILQLGWLLHHLAPITILILEWSMFLLTPTSLAPWTGPTWCLRKLLTTCSRPTHSPNWPISCSLRSWQGGGRWDITSYYWTLWNCWPCFDLWLHTTTPTYKIGPLTRSGIRIYLWLSPKWNPILTLGISQLTRI